MIQYRNPVKLIFIVLFSVGIFFDATAQGSVTSGNGIQEIIEKIKVSYELEKLNDCRIKLRGIEFSKLKSQEERELYASAYKMLAYSFRNHRYVRPGYDIYQKYITLRDTLLKIDKDIKLLEIENKYKSVNNKLTAAITEKENERKVMLSEKSFIASMKKNYRIWTIVLTLLGISAFIYFLKNIDRKYRDAKINKEENRKQILTVNRAAWKGQMSAGALNRISYLNKLVWEQSQNAEHNLSEAETELKTVKETTGLIKNIKDDISRMKQLAEIAMKKLEKIKQEIPVLKQKSEIIMLLPRDENSGKPERV